MPIHDSLAMRMRGAYLLMRRRFQVAFATYGATADQFVVLTLLTEEQGITQQELANRSFSDANTMAAMLNLLEKTGFIRREPHQRDRRARCVYLTREGRSLQKKLAQAGQPVAEMLEGSVTETGLRQMRTSLGRVAEVMKQNGHAPEGNHD